MSRNQTFAIVGAVLAGAAETLRQTGFDGQVLLPGTRFTVAGSDRYDSQLRAAVSRACTARKSCSSS